MCILQTDEFVCWPVPNIKQKNSIVRQKPDFSAKFKFYVKQNYQRDSTSSPIPKFGKNNFIAPLIFIKITYFSRKLIAARQSYGRFIDHIRLKHFDKAIAESLFTMYSRLHGIQLPEYG
jgi:hypothetical protein